MLTPDEIMHTSAQTLAPDHPVRVLAREIERLRDVERRAAELLDRSRQLLETANALLGHTQRYEQRGPAPRDTLPECVAIPPGETRTVGGVAVLNVHACTLYVTPDEANPLPTYSEPLQATYSAWNHWRTR